MPLTRRPRPVAACLLVGCAGVELAVFPLARPGLLGVQGLSATAALLLAAALGGCADLWTRPHAATRTGAAAVLLGLLSYPLANLGGFLLGMMLALTGGSLALAWRGTEDDTPQAPDHV
ncbi:DUF6114 domain-containing protein [Streptomyces viridochromogenes]|uniref:Integral membrane protein n=1 Tax=Streptomyces viridochromogenes Tue57 TaxID=1160705 RepID=L8PPX9_STRVR|nr:DUF6114 domain-containing protein [Streptomyces viridochromogenes]ELS58570.1 hypothetical protein STVIR_0466 [Streptomyces viridochromogenes Tue57]